MTAYFRDIFLLSVIALAAFSFKNRTVKPDMYRANLKGPVKSFTEVDSLVKYDSAGIHIKLFMKMTREYDVKGRLIKSIEYSGINGKEKSYTIHTFDVKGKSTGFVTYKPNGQVDSTKNNTTVLRYDKLKRPVESWVTNISTGKKYIDYSIYDKMGNKIEQYRYNDEGRLYIQLSACYDQHHHLIWKDSGNGENRGWGYQYDNRGLVNVKDELDSDENVMRKIVYTYNRKKQKILQGEYDSLNKLIRTQVYKYDKFGTANSTMFLDNRGILVETETHELVYDKYGNWINRITHDNDTITYKRKREMEYYK